MQRMNESRKKACEQLKSLGAFSPVNSQKWFSDDFNLIISSTELVWNPRIFFLSPQTKTNNTAQMIYVNKQKTQGAKYGARYLTNSITVLYVCEL